MNNSTDNDNEIVYEVSVKAKGVKPANAETEFGGKNRKSKKGGRKSKKAKKSLKKRTRKSRRRV
jgi:hypothetical protein